MWMTRMMKNTPLKDDVIIAKQDTVACLIKILPRICYNMEASATFIIEFSLYHSFLNLLISL